MSGSPNGRATANGRVCSRIRGRGARASGLWVADADGSRSRWIARVADPYHAVRGLAWAPDGRSVVVASHLFGTFGLFSVRVGGRAPHQVRVIRYQHPAGSLPEWSPDGSLILFSGVQGGFLGTYVMRPDGSNARRLRGCGSPAWSPDGSLIACSAYSQQPPGELTITVMSRTGKLLERIAVHGAGLLGGPAWSTDGTTLAYTLRPPFSGPRDNPGVYIARLDSRVSHRIVAPTSGRVGFSNPLWRPDRAAQRSHTKPSPSVNSVASASVRE